MMIFTSSFLLAVFRRSDRRFSASHIGAFLPILVGGFLPN
jgi:hypothetical protein